MAKDFYKVLDIKKEVSPDDIKAAFHRLARKYHPDVNGGKDERFKEINEAYDVLSDPDKRARYDKHGMVEPIIIPTKTGKYTVDRLYAIGDLADVYKAKSDKGEDVALKIARHPSHNDLLENEWRMLNQVRPPDKNEWKQFRFFPKPIETLKISTAGMHRQANIMTWAEDHYTLDEVRLAFGADLPIAHGIWMFRRILSALSWVNQGKQIVHGALVPSNIMVFSGTGGVYDHGAKLIDWSYAVPVGEKLKTMIPKYEVFYPPEIFRKEPVDGTSDIYMAAKCIIYVLGGDVFNTHADTYPGHVPPYLKNFLRGCTLKSKSSRPRDAYELLKEFTECMAQNYGPRKYVPFSVPLST